MSRREPNSALTTAQWKELETAVFKDAGVALTSIRDWANYRVHSPVPAVIMCALWSLTSLPAGTTFNAGLGDGSVNTLVALVGNPGQGKDIIIGDIARDLTVTHASGKVVEVEEAGIGTGEGIISNCQPGDDGKPAAPILFGISEVSGLEAHMKRQGAILRPTIMSMYSGNALGVTNKSEKTYVPRNSYTAGLWVGVQPDKAGALLSGADDGLAHRFIWTELVSPNLDPQTKEHRLLPVMIPDGINKGFTYPEKVREQTRTARIEAVKYGAPGDHRGHRHQTRLKLAAGLALLRSSREVSMDDWKRSGVIMDYSDTVRRHCLAHVEDKDIEDEADRMERREAAVDRTHLNRVRRNRRRILEALADDSSEEPVKWYPLMRARPGRERDSMVEALNQLTVEGAVLPNLDSNGHTETLSQGDKFAAVCERDGTTPSLRAVS